MRVRDSWYRHAGPEEPLSQGELVFGCPVLFWSPDAGFEEILDPTYGDPSLCDRLDVIVASQTCDLYADKLGSAVVCAHLAIEEHHRDWRDWQGQQGDAPGNAEKWRRAWGREWQAIRNLQQAHRFMLAEDNVGEHTIGTRVVYLDEVFAVPVAVLRKAVGEQTGPRWVLRPPYREQFAKHMADMFSRVAVTRRPDAAGIGG